MPYTVSFAEVIIPFRHRDALFDSGIAAKVDSTTAWFLSTQYALGASAAVNLNSVYTSSGNRFRPVIIVDRSRTISDTCTGWKNDTKNALPCFLPSTRLYFVTVVV